MALKVWSLLTFSVLLNAKRTKCIKSTHYDLMKKSRTGLIVAALFNQPLHNKAF